MKKIICLVLIVLLSTMLFSSCSVKDSENENSGENLLKNAVITATENGKKAAKMPFDSAVWTAKTQGAEMEFDFGEEIAFNTITISEKTDCVKKFSVYVFDKTDYILIYTQNRIDTKRICAVEDTITSKIKIVFDEFDDTLKINNISVSYIKDIKRDNFKVTSYLNSSLDEATGLTQVQAGANDKGYTDRFKNLTDVIFIGVIYLNEDATITSVTGMDNFKKDVQILKSINPQMKVRCTLMTGLVNDNFNANKKAMVKFAKEKLDKYKINLYDFVTETGIDGIDFDWEYPQLPHEWSAYNKLLIASKQALNGGDLSVALWPYGVQLSKEARACIDNVNIMAYDQFDDRGDHSSIYNCGQKTIDYFLDLGFDKEQLCFGIPFYGRTADKYNIWPMYDEEYGKWSNYREDFHYTDGDGNEQVSTVFLNGYTMVRDKTALAIDNDLGGIMIFSSTADISQDSEYALHKAVNEVLKQRIKTN